MKATITVKRMIEMTETYEVQVDFQDLKDELGLSPIEYNDDPDGAVAEYCETNMEALIEEGGGWDLLAVTHGEECVEIRDGHEDEMEFVEAEKS